MDVPTAFEYIRILCDSFKIYVDFTLIYDLQYALSHKIKMLNLSFTALHNIYKVCMTKRNIKTDNKDIISFANSLK